MAKSDVKKHGAIRIIAVIVVMAVVAIVIVIAFLLPGNGSIRFRSEKLATSTNIVVATSTTSTPEPVSIVTHIAPPTAIKGIYFTSWAAGTPSFRKSLSNLLDGTILNAVVIDVKDYSGRISFAIDDPEISAIGSYEKRIPDIEEFIAELHKKGIYVIARVAVFQDPFLVKVKPKWAVVSSSTGKPWKDSGGSFWVDPTNKEIWKYIVAIARGSYAVGFDEINFDYIRFPSDGSVSTAVYSALPKGSYIYKPIENISASSTIVATSSKIVATSTKLVATSTRIFITGRSKVIRDFSAYLRSELSMPISADLFGQVTSDTGDMGIGQVLENAMPYFDYIDPMVYPSHYINGFLGYEKPAKFPYEIVKYEMDQAVARSIAASSSPLLMRPWLQAFDLGAVYTSEMVRAQIRATYDAGLTSWILWNAGSVYDKSALLTDPKPTAKILTKITNSATNATSSSNLR